ncbi:MAG: murein biosynthesis integral membrane protein MurJ, partial [Pseudomonadota bacterium]
MVHPLLKSMATVSGLTLVSRVLGFARQMLLAGIIGASGNPVADAFWAAFRLPNMFRRLLAEGAFQAAFIPLFQKESAGRDLKAGRLFAEDILAWLVVILTGLKALVMIFTPVFVSQLATGFRTDPERFDLTILYTRIMFPYLACMSVVGIYGGMLNALGRFAAAAAAPLLLNICLIVGVLLFADAPPKVTGYAAAWAVMAGGVLQLLALIFAALRSKLLLRLRLPRFTGAVKRMLVLGTPGFIGASALQVNAIIGTNIASRQDGAVSWLIYADQLYQLPLAMIGIALGIVLMPAIGRSITAGDEKGAVDTLNKGLEIALFFALPAAAALIAMPDFLCAALFQDMAGDVTQQLGAGQSAFNDRDVNQTGLALL